MASPHLPQTWQSFPKGAGITGRPLSIPTVSPQQGGARVPHPQEKRKTEQKTQGA